VARAGRGAAPARSIRRGAGRLTGAHPRAIAREIGARTAVVPRLALAPDPDVGPYDDAVELETRLAGGELGEGAELLLGWLGAVPIAIVRGASPPVVPIRVARLLGAGIMLVTRRVRALGIGGAPGGLGVVVDHLGLLVPNPLIGPNADDLGTRFPDMTEAYDPALRTLAQEEARRAGSTLTSGVYAAHPDPNLATPAEYSMLRSLGADWVGAGAVPEVLVARHAGMRVLGLVGLEGSEGPLARLTRVVVDRLGAGA
jgi:purine-nucleoside phosphorylase